MDRPPETEEQPASLQIPAAPAGTAEGRRRSSRGRGWKVAGRTTSRWAAVGGAAVLAFTLLSGSPAAAAQPSIGPAPIQQTPVLSGGSVTVTWIDKTTGQTSTHDIGRVFIMAGASPRTEWLEGCVAMDDKGFIITGRDLDGAAGIVPPIPWPLTRAPQMLETSLPGVFAVGDARAGNVKRVASAVGEGAIAIHLVHRTLGEL